MRKVFSFMAVTAGLLLATAGTSAVVANCTASIMPVFQCGFVGWVAPAPQPGTPLNPAGPPPGAVSAIWWQLGYGNNNVNNGAISTAANEGTGIGSPGVFSGNDSGVAQGYTASTCGRTNGQPGVTMTEARCVLPQYAASIPVGALCSNYENSWAGAGIDGCADNPRTTAAADNDNLLNPYFGSTYGPCADPLYCDAPYYTTAYQIDYPMAILVRENTNRFFALAFLASKARVQVEGSPDPPKSRAADISENFFDLATISNGDPRPALTGPSGPLPAKNNIIPWQLVPKPRVMSVTGTNPKQLSLQWDNIRMVNDGSTRPNARLVGPGQAGGVGVLDQGILCRYQLQTAPITTANPDPTTLTWTNAGAAINCGSGLVNTSLTVNPDSAIRIRTILGKTPRTASTLLASARIGASGDLGFEATDCKANNCVNSAPLIFVAGGLVSEQAVDTVAIRNKNAVTVSFHTTSELTVSSIDILGKGDVVLKTVPCKQCTTGIGDDYSVLMTSGDLKGSKELKVRLNGPGAVSPSFPIQ
jgi:hypothetical protein